MDVRVSGVSCSDAGGSEEEAVTDRNKEQYVQVSTQALHVSVRVPRLYSPLPVQARVRWVLHESRQGALAALREGFQSGLQVACPAVR